MKEKSKKTENDKNKENKDKNPDNKFQYETVKGLKILGNK